MWGAILGLAGTAASGIMSAINNKKMKQASDAESARQQALYAAKANENPLSRSENQHLLGKYDRDSQQQIETARNVATITGATPEYGLGVQKAVAQGRADLMGQMSAGASERADKYNQLGEDARHQKFLDDQVSRAARNETFAALASNAANAVGSIADSYSAGKQAATPTEQADQKLATGGAQVADGTTSIHIDRNGQITGPNDWMQRHGIEQRHIQNLFGKGAMGFVPAGDGTFMKDGARYMQNPDGSYRLIF